MKQAGLELPAADLIRRVGISEQTFYHGKKEYAGLEPDQAHEFKQLADENARLKKLVAELSFDKAVLEDALAKKIPACAHARHGTYVAAGDSDSERRTYLDSPYVLPIFLTYARSEFALHQGKGLCPVAISKESDPDAFVRRQSREAFRYHHLLTKRSS